MVAVSPDFSRDQTIVVATGTLTTSMATHAVLRSTNGGAGWEVVRGLPNTPSTSIRFSPAFEHDGTAFVGNVLGLYRSVDRGRSWTRAGSSPSGVTGIAISPDFDRSQTLYVLTEDGRLHVSADQGTSFGPLPSAPPEISQTAISPNAEADHTMLAGTKGGLLYRSLDGGKTWTEQAATGPAPVTAFAFSPGYERDSTVFATSYGRGVWASTDGGATWRPSAGQPSDQQATDVALSPDFSGDSTLYVTAADGVFTSTDGAASWSKLPATGRRSPQTTRHCTSIAVARLDSARQVIVLGTFEGLWQKEPSAARWTYDEIVPTHVVRFLQASPGYARDRTLAASTYGGGILLSADGGESWRYANTGLTNSYPMPVRFSPTFAADGILFTGVWNGLLRSNDRGAHWEPIAMMGVPVFPRAIGISPTFATDSAMFLGTDNRGTDNPPRVSYGGDAVPTQGLFSSTDKGGTWIPRGLPEIPVSVIEISPGYGSDGTIFAGAVPQGLYRSHTRGEAWIPVPEITEPVLAVAVSPQFPSDHTVFVGTTIDLFKSVDGGTTWTKLSAAGSDTAVGIALSPSFETDQTMFVATLSKGLTRSKDGGRTFSELTLPDTYVSAVAISPEFASDHEVFAAGYQGIYGSGDGGSTWHYSAVPGRIEESRTGNVILRGRWQSVTDPSASSMEYTVTQQPAASLIVEFTGTGVTWIGPKGPSMSGAEVALDELPSEQVPLSADEPQGQQRIWTRPGLTCVRHTLRITAMEREGRTGVALDALDVSRDSTCLSHE